MKKELKSIFTKDEIAGLVEMLCKLNEENISAVKRAIKANANKVIEALEQ
jgi:hypothetical protein